MNSFDKVYKIRLARVSETEKVMRYISEDWRHGHIMSVNKELFLHEFNPTGNDRLNLVIAVRKDNGQIDGMLGFIPASDTASPDLWGSIWKIRKGSMMFLGNEIMKRLLDIAPHRYYASVGINIATTGKLVNKTMGYYVGRLHHWYILNNNIEYKIARIYEEKKTGFKNSQIQIIAAQNINDVDRCFNYSVLNDALPFKDRWYIKRRYFDYPINKYEIYLVGGEKADALLVMKPVNVNGSKAARIIDFIGNKNEIGNLGNFLHEKIVGNDYEYVDFYENGFSKALIRESGFTERLEDDKNIIPNYFTPFEQKNVEIYFHSPFTEYTFCKGDGDQDRPN